MNKLELLKLFVASWNNYKKYCKKTGIIRDFIKWLEDDEFGIRSIRKYAKSITPYEFQVTAIEKLLKIAPVGKTFIIEAPTASGKTEVPFTVFLNQLLERDFKIAPRLVYSLPIRSLSNTMWTRTSVYLLATLISNFENINEVKEFMENKKWLLDGVLELPIGLETGSLIKEGDYLYGGFITVGTIDSIIYAYVSQRIPGFMRNPRLSLPSGLLVSSLFILDEIQMLQDTYYYSPRILNIILRQLASVHVPMIIMTATMPSELKTILLSNIDYEEIKCKESKRGSVSLNTTFLRKGKKLLEILKMDTVIKEIKSKCEDGRNVLIVSNRVSVAKEVYRRLSSIFGHKTLLIHGKLNIRDRKVAENRLESEKGVVIISTQVVESGFDFDAVLLISEIAPLDSLLQRIGRVARRAGDEGTAYIADVETYKPYHEDIINNTRVLLIEDSSTVEKALQNIDITKDLLDEVYTKENTNNFIREKEKELARSCYYLKKLRLFSLPPEDIEFNFRPEWYVTLITTNDEEVRELVDKVMKEKEITFSRDEFNIFKEVLEKNSLNVSKNLAEHLKESGLLLGKLERSYFYGEQRVKIRINEDIQHVHPLTIWLLKPLAYEINLGLIDVEGGD